MPKLSMLDAGDIKQLESAIKPPWSALEAQIARFQATQEVIRKMLPEYFKLADTTTGAD